MQLLTIWLNKLVKQIPFLVLMLLPFVNKGQTHSSLTLKEAFDLAEKNYPLMQQKGLLQQTEALNIKNLNTAYLPQANFNAQASYQSDVTKLDISIPGVKIPQQSKDQYKATADVSQLLFDGGQTKEQKNLQQLTTSVEESKVDIELFNLKNRVNQLYFSTLYQQELLKQTELFLKDVQVGIDKIKPQVENGTMLRSNLLLLEAQALQTKQREIEIQNTRKGLLDALATLVNISIDVNTQLQKTEVSISTDTAISRPELALYNNQIKFLKAQENLIDAKNLPKVSAFVQGGYGRPGLNFLSNEFVTYYIGGLRINWSLGSLYNAKRDKKLLEVNQRSIDLQKATFLLNTQSQLNQQMAEINKYIDLINTDKAIIEVRKKITDAAKAQLENAVITTNDYVKEINAQDQAQQSLIMHQIQLLQAQINYAITTGKF